MHTKGKVALLPPVNAVETPRIIFKTPDDLQTIQLCDHQVWTIGRDPTSLIRITDRFASRFHAKLKVFKERHCCFWDLNSSNGSLYNGQPVKGQVLLSHGDQITIGNAELTFKHSFVTKHDQPALQLNRQVLMVQGSAVQGKIWQEIFLSQDVAVIWETPFVDLKQLIGLRTASHTLPELLVIDVRAVSAEIYELSRWCRTQEIKTQILLIDSQETEVSKSDQSKAKSKGFLGLYPAFSQALMSHKTELAQQMQTVFNGFGKTSLNQAQLFKALASLEQMLYQTVAPAVQSPASIRHDSDPSLDDLTALKVDPRRKVK